MARSEDNPVKETEVPTHVIVKGARAMLPQDDNTYAVREAAYARKLKAGNISGWSWYLLLEKTSVWRDGVRELNVGDQILVGPKGAVKKK